MIETMWYRRTFLLACLSACEGPYEPKLQGRQNNLAQDDPSGSSLNLSLAANPLLAELKQVSPESLPSIISTLENMGTPERGVPPAPQSPTPAEIAQIQANSAFTAAYSKNSARTVLLIHQANDILKAKRQYITKGAPKRIALVVGTRGDSTWTTLATSANDAALLAKNLTRCHFEIFNNQSQFELNGAIPAATNNDSKIDRNVQELLGLLNNKPPTEPDNATTISPNNGALIDPSKEELEDAIAAFGKSIGPDTIALFYYAGHGVQFGENNYLVPRGAAIPHSVRDFSKNLVSVNDTVLKVMQQANNQLNIIVLDACRDHPPIPVGAPTTGLAGTTPALGNTAIFYSTLPDHTAQDRGTAHPEYSPFAWAFATAMLQDGLDLYQFYQQIVSAVLAETTQRQRPTLTTAADTTFYISDESPHAVTMGRMQSYSEETYMSGTPGPSNSLLFKPFGLPGTSTITRSPSVSISNQTGVIKPFEQPKIYPFQR